MNRLAEERQTPWIIAASPAIWAMHFLLCYVTGALWCGMAPDPRQPLGAVRIAVAAYTAAALAGIGIIGAIGFRRHRYGLEPPPHDADSPEDRHRFIGFSTVLLSGLSAVAVVYAALVVLFVESCE